MLYKGREHKKIFNGDRRTLLIKKNIIWSFLIKGWSGAVLFLLVPYTIDCLGEYKNGVWLTVSSVLVWIEQMDIGLGNGLRNKIATCLAKKDYNEASSAIASTYHAMMFGQPTNHECLCNVIDAFETPRAKVYHLGLGGNPYCYWSGRSLQEDSWSNFLQMAKVASQN